jgi:hypothetical protein
MGVLIEEQRREEDGTHGKFWVVATSQAGASVALNKKLGDPTKAASSKQ